VEGHLRRIQGLEERLKETEELLATRSAELSGAQTFLSTTDRLSEVEVLSIVRDLNENIFQVAVNLTEEWEKLDPPQATGQMDADPASGSHFRTLRPRPRPAGPQPRPHGFDLPAPVTSLFPGSGDDLDLGPPQRVGCTRVYLQTLICIR
jgi:hypothetical protein